MTRMCHPEAQPKDLADEREILRFAQNDSFTVTLITLAHFSFSIFWILILLIFLASAEAIVNFRFS
jgi:hypothetical protein